MGVKSLIWLVGPVFPESLRCNIPLGMQDGSIADFQIKASSELPSYPARNARPGFSGWCTEADDEQPFLQVKYI